MAASTTETALDTAWEALTTTDRTAVARWLRARADVLIERSEADYRAGIAGGMDCNMDLAAAGALRAAAETLDPAGP